MAEKRELQKALEEMRSIIESHQWDDLTPYFAEENLQFQIEELGMALPQYIEEAIGLNLVDNYLPVKPGGRTDFSRLNSIERFEGTGKDATRPGLVTVTGRIHVHDGTRRQFEFDLRLHSDGRYRFELATG